MLNTFFSWLEQWRTPFPETSPEMPPQRFWPFILHYTKPYLPMLAASSLLAAVVALIEVWLFSFLGQLVDWLAAADRATFWETHGTFLIAMSVVVVVVL